MLQLTKHALIRAMEHHNLNEEQLRQLLISADGSPESSVILRKIRGSHHRLTNSSGGLTIDMIIVKNYVVTILPSERTIGPEYARFIRFYDGAVKHGLEFDFQGFLHLQAVAIKKITKHSVINVTIQVQHRLIQVTVGLSNGNKMNKFLALRDADNSSPCDITDREGKFFWWTSV